MDKDRARRATADERLIAALDAENDFLTIRFRYRSLLPIWGRGGP